MILIYKNFLNERDKSSFGISHHREEWQVSTMMNWQHGMRKLDIPLDV